ncbi:MAG TPA: DUF4157 domain-containing protein, partial [Burkholderiales bacterium]|nr:DUF4157 domain-containing protein [Burkholderiales bacterium]
MQLIQNLPEEHFVNLPDATRRRMTQIFSCDLSMIRFSLTTLPLSFNAAAFSSGSTIYFAPRFYRPGHPLGDAMIAHEIAHLLQQCSLSDYAPLAGHASLLVSPELDEEANAWACLSLMDASTLEKFINRPSQAQRFQPREGNRIVQPWIMMAKDIGDDPDSYGPNHDIGHRFGERYFRPPEQQRGEPKAENFVQLTDIDDACQRVEKAYYYLFRKAPPKEVYEILRRWIGISEATGEILARRGIKEEFSKAAVDERKEKEVYAEWRYYHTYAELAWALDGERKAKQELDKENAIAGLVLEDNDILFLLKRVGDRVNQFLKTQQEEDSPVHRDIIGASGKAAPYATLHKRTTYQDVIAAIQNNKDIDNVAHLAALFHDVKDIFKSAKVIASSEQDFVLKVQSEQKDLLINPRNNRYNVSTVDEADPWTLWMREEGRPVWAAPSPTMMSMWLMTKKVGALDIENEALGYAMFALWNKVYSHYASPIHRFHETLSGAQHNNIPFAPDLDAPTNYANFKGRVATQLQASAEETQAMPSPLQTAPEAVVAQGSSSKAIEESEYAPISETKSPDTLAEAVASLLKSAPYLLPILLNDLTKVEPHELEAIGQRLAAPLPAGIKKLGGQTGFVIQQLTSFLPEFVVGAAGTMTGIALRL